MSDGNGRGNQSDSEVSEASGTQENSLTNAVRPNRRQILQGMAAIGAAGVSGTALGDTNEFSPRIELSGERVDAAIENARGDPRTAAVLEEVPATPNFDEASAYRIDADGKEITQVLTPLDGIDSKLGYATSPADTAIGARVSEGRIVQFVESPEYDSKGVEHKRIVEGNEEQHFYSLVRNNQQYKELGAEKASTHHVEHQEVQVTIIEEQERGIVYIPVTAKDSHEDEHAAIVATIDTSSEDVIRVQGGCWSCVANCLATKSAFYGACWTCCCQWCWVDASRATCVGCAGCIGVPVGICTAQCAPCIVPW